MGALSLMFPPQAVCKCFCVARVIKLSVELNNCVVMRAPQGRQAAELSLRALFFPGLLK